jgi:cytochrome c peroxidase
MRRGLVTVALAVNAACGGEVRVAPEVWDFGLPAHFPAPKVPEDNPMSAAKVGLGRRLFYDTRLSGNETQSCATCHEQARAFTDGKARGVGSTGEVHPRGAMGLTNVAYAATLNWANPVVRRLEAQALIPMFGESPVELGMAGREDELFARLAADPAYPAAFEAAFPGRGVSLDTITQALAAFERTLISAGAPYDRYLAGDAGALSDAARRGLGLFLSERLECFHCHGGFNFTGSVDHEGNVFDQAAFFNNGLYDVGGLGRYPEDAPGLYEHTQDPTDHGRFKAPTLRNIAVTAPYMHDGRLATLDDVIDHYSRGGTLTADGPNAGDGRSNPNKSSFVVGFELSADERRDLLAFLHSLTDEGFLTDPRFGAPE